MTPEDDWLRTVARENERLERARLIQPGRGHRSHREQPWADWAVLAIIIGVLLASLLC